MYICLYILYHILSYTYKNIRIITHYFSLTKIISIYTVLGGIVPSLAPLKFVTATAIIGFIYELFERTFWSALLPGKRRK